MLRVNALAQVVRDGVKTIAPTLTPQVLEYLGATCAAMLEEKLGGVVRVQYFRDAVPMCAEWIRANISGYVAVDAAAVDAVAVAAVEKFKEMLTEVAKAILADSGDKNFSLDIQNIILAFAGRVLLRKADVRFERGHRYGLIGQNGTGKTTLLNRLSAKDINGFPQELKTWYIRHEVLCEDGITVKTFLKQNAPEEKQTDAAILQARETDAPRTPGAAHTHSTKAREPSCGSPLNIKSSRLQRRQTERHARLGDRRGGSGRRRLLSQRIARQELVADVHNPARLWRCAQARGPPRHPDEVIVELGRRSRGLWPEGTKRKSMYDDSTALDLSQTQSAVSPSRASLLSAGSSAA